MLYGFGEGWHEDEYDAISGRRVALEQRAVDTAGQRSDGRSFALTLRGESPLRYFDVPPSRAHHRRRACDRAVSARRRFRVDDDCSGR